MQRFADFHMSTDVVGFSHRQNLETKVTTFTVYCLSQKCKFRGISIFFSLHTQCYPYFIPTIY